MYTFLGSFEMAFAPGAVGKNEEMGRADLRRERSMSPLFMACLRHNLENHRSGEK